MSDGATVYEVTMDVAPEQAAALERYMRERHIPEILATRSFVSITFERASATRFRTRYAGRTRTDVERYLVEHTGRFRADFALHFPSGVVATREVWEAVESW